MNFFRIVPVLATILVLAQCKSDPKTATSSDGAKRNQKPAREWKKPAATDFQMATKKMRDSLVKSSELVSEILTTVNRTDIVHLKQMDSILVPVDLKGDKEMYLPFPTSAPALKDISKIIFFSYPAQAFGAYEYGNLVYGGATNMGRKKDPTPTGLYFTNWKAEETKSTFNDEWELKWNFNIENKEGIGWHQYELPGYPASHSCLRLTEKDAKYLYEWADQWNIKGTDNILAKGTPVIVFGTYDFDGKKPWLQLAKDPKALDISADLIEKETNPFLSEILKEQEKRDNFIANKK